MGQIITLTRHCIERVAHHPTSYPPDIELGLQGSAVYDPGKFA